MNCIRYPNSGRITFFACIFNFMFLLYGCKKFVEVPLPETQLTANSVFSNDITANAAVLGLYPKMDLYFTIPLCTGLTGDEFKLFANELFYTQFYYNNLTADNIIVNSIWDKCYSTIYQTNSVIEGLHNSNSINPKLKKQLLGECYFVRAFNLFYLTNLFGAVPIVTTTNYPLNSSVSRNTSQQVYDSLISDLTKSADLLEEKYVDNDGLSESMFRFRPNKFCAMALLARVFLYNGEFNKSENICSAIIDHTDYYSLEPLSNIFLNTSKEVIWQISDDINYNTVEGNTYILTSTPTLVSLEPRFVNQFDAHDRRKSVWIKSFTDVNGTEYFYANKYVQQYSQIRSESSVLFRLAEILFIRSECRARQKNHIGSLEDLNLLRVRAGLKLLSSDNIEFILDAIYSEREHELFSEGGHRWLDLKRSQKLNHFMESYQANKGSSWNVNDTIFPIPQKEISRNKNISQNIGY